MNHSNRYCCGFPVFRPAILTVTESGGYEENPIPVTPCTASNYFDKPCSWPGGAGVILKYKACAKFNPAFHAAPSFSRQGPSFPLQPLIRRKLPGPKWSEILPQQNLAYKKENAIILIKNNNDPILKIGIFPSSKQGNFTPLALWESAGWTPGEACRQPAGKRYVIQWIHLKINNIFKNAPCSIKPPTRMDQGAFWKRFIRTPHIFRTKPLSLQLHPSS